MSRHGPPDIDFANYLQIENSSLCSALPLYSDPGSCESLKQAEWAISQSGPWAAHRKGVSEMLDFLRTGILAMLATAVHLAVLCDTPAHSQSAHVFSEEGVLGSYYELRVEGSDVEIAGLAHAAARAEIDRLSGIFNLYDATSEISRLNTTASTTVSPELFHLLQVCEDWTRRTSNAFSCRIGELIDIWRQATVDGEEPSRGITRLLANNIRRAEVTLDAATRTVSRPDPVRFATDGIAKGYIIDQALAAAQAAAPEASGLLLNIGGDIGTIGTPNHRAYWHVDLPGGLQGRYRLSRSAAIATSGSGPRDLEIGDMRYTHIIDTLSGWAGERVVSATVVAPTAEQADTLATVFVVMSVQSAINLTNSLDGVSTLIRTGDGRVFHSANWRVGELADNDQISQSPFRLILDYEIPEIETSSYRAPYLAIWITDSDRNLVRTLAMLGDRARWREETYYWWRRYGRHAPDLVDAMSEPTRRPGRYHFTWDGHDDFGQAVPDGEYTLFVETAREYGEHAMWRIPLIIGAENFDVSMEPEGEHGALNVEFERF